MRSRLDSIGLGTLQYVCPSFHRAGEQRSDLFFDTPESGMRSRGMYDDNEIKRPLHNFRLAPDSSLNPPARVISLGLSADFSRSRNSEESGARQTANSKIRP